jgi:hypothetical protein
MKGLDCVLVVVAVKSGLKPKPDAVPLNPNVSITGFQELVVVVLKPIPPG